MGLQPRSLALSARKKALGTRLTIVGLVIDILFLALLNIYYKFVKLLHIFSSVSVPVSVSVQFQERRENNKNSPKNPIYFEGDNSSSKIVT